jgi:nucleotide-binding universal stress UspA family protein
MRKEFVVPKTLLVPLDGSDLAGRALPIVGQLAERVGGDIVLVAAETGGVSVPATYLDAAAAFTGSRGAHVEVVQCVTLADALRAVADDANDPAICMATHARSGMGHALFGSAAEAVVRTLQVPAVLVGPHCDTTLRVSGPLAVCFDGSAASAAVLQLAEQWARALATPIVLVYVYHPLDVESATHPETIARTAAERLSIDAEVHLVRGESAHSVVRAVRDVDPVLVALATHGRTGLARLVMGSVATAVVRRSECPALVVRPPANALTARSAT